MANNTDIASTKNWYIVHTYSGYEERVKRNLEQRVKYMDASDKIFQIVIPTEDEIEIRSGQKRTVTKKIFPGYVLVQMKMDDESWHVVRNTPGITGFVGGGNKPTPLSETEVKSILKQMEDGSPKIKVGFRKGESVRVVDGPFTDFILSLSLLISFCNFAGFITPDCSLPLTLKKILE